MFDCLAPSHVATQQRRHCCRARAGAQPVQAPAPLSAQEHDGALQSRGEAGGLHSNRALGGTEMDLHGNNKAVKEKEKEPHPEIKWVCETGELTRESPWRKDAHGWEGVEGELGCLLSAARFCSDVHKQSFAIQGKSL